MYYSYVGEVHGSKSDAETYRSSDCLACIKVEIEYTEGEGLE